MEDRELIDRFVQGDRACFDELVKKYQKLVFNVCAKMLRDYQEALDVAQDIFLKLFESLKDFRHEAKFSTYLYTVTLNACRNRLRAMGQRKKHVAFSLDEPIASDDGPVKRELPGNDDPRQNVAELEQQEILRKELRALTDDYREIIVLKDIEGLKYEEIAGILDVDIGTVKSRLSRARQALRVRLEKIL
jgi:RNA polymerase sigma-70 factor, ECF subfamily